MEELSERAESVGLTIGMEADSFRLDALKQLIPRSRLLNHHLHHHHHRHSPDGSLQRLHRLLRHHPRSRPRRLNGLKGNVSFSGICGHSISSVRRSGRTP